MRAPAVLVTFGGLALALTGMRLHAGTAAASVRHAFELTPQGQLASGAALVGATLVGICLQRSRVTATYAYVALAFLLCTVPAYVVEDRLASVRLAETTAALSHGASAAEVSVSAGAAIYLLCLGTALVAAGVCLAAAAAADLGAAPAESLAPAQPAAPRAQAATASGGAGPTGTGRQAS